MRPGHGERKGFVLMAVIFSIAIMSLVVVVAFTTSDDERRSARASRESTLALYAADAGLRATLGNWPTAAVANLNPGDSVDLGWKTIPNGGSYRPIVLRVDSGGLQHYSVMVHGRRANSFGGQATVISMVAGAPRFKSAVTAHGAITMSGSSNGIIDAYDSDVAPYSALSTDTANVVSNGSVSLYNAFTIRGDLTSASTTWNTTGVTGTVRSFAPPFAANPILACPTTGYTASIPLPINNSRMSYSPTTGILELESNAGNLTLSGPTKYYFSRVVIYGGSSVTFDGGGQPVEVVVNDILGFGGGSVINASGKPTKLSFSSCGSPTSPQRWYVGGGTGAQYSVYAPNHDIEIVGGGAAATNNIYGALVGASVLIPSATRLHYDVALTRLPSRTMTIVPGSWAQLPR